ncbi:hypothetical protein G6F63_015435 [Rhizopus arrhizus]|nr:hypothetical protein G6F63_015435 [Rhizopus arrhizus]
MPTSAAARAGASLMPSPAMATRRPWALSCWARSALSCGLTPPRTSSMPSVRPTASAVACASPEAITTCRPSARSRFKAGKVVALMGSATAMAPANRPLTARNITLAPSFRRRSALLCKGATSAPTDAIRLWLPSTTS